HLTRGPGLSARGGGVTRDPPRRGGQRHRHPVPAPAEETRGPPSAQERARGARRRTGADGVSPRVIETSHGLTGLRTAHAEPQRWHTTCAETVVFEGFHTLQGHIWTRPCCQGALEWTNTLRDRCSHISGLWVKTSHGLRALMKSALPRLITTAASGALSLHRLRGSWSDRSCHQLDYTSHCAARLLHIPVK